MSRVAPTTIWEESNARRITSRAQRAYAAESGGRWHLSTAPADEDATFALDSGGRLVQVTPVAATTARVFLLGDAGRVFMTGLPTV